MSTPIHQELKLPASPRRVYEALTDAGAFGQFTGAPAVIDARAGGEFSCFSSQIEGRQIELIPGRRIVQAWRVAGWDPGVYSIVRFELHATGSETTLVMDQDGFPEDARDHLEPGWHKMYWEPLVKFLAVR